MFLESSRYADVEAVEAEAKGGRKVSAVKLRRLPYVAGTPTVVRSNERLDIIAQQKFSDGTKFWHIADANTELEAGDLLKGRAQTDELRVVNVPES
jgi:hypothetical protein